MKPMEMVLHILLILGSSFFFFLIIYLMKKNKLEVKYSIIWLAFSCVMVVFSYYPYIVLVLSDITRIINPVNFIFFIQIAFILLILLSVSIAISSFSKKIKQLAQKNALLENRVRELENKLSNE